MHHDDRKLADNGHAFIRRKDSYCEYDAPDCEKGYENKVN